MASRTVPEREESLRGAAPDIDLAGARRLLDEDLADLAHDASAEADLRAARKGLALADFECRHGRLPGDPGPGCGCLDRNGNAR